MASFNKLGLLARSLSTTSATAQLVVPPIQVFGIEGRYACALYSAASKNKILEVVEKDLTAFQKEMRADEKLRDFIMDPSIKRDLKASALKEVCTQIKFNAATGFLMQTMAENGRLKKMDAVINAYKLIMAAHRGEVVCEVTTAKPLEAGQRQQLEASLKKFIQPNETILLTAVVDQSILGGMVVSIGDKYADMSVASKIKKMTDLISTPI